MPLAIGVGLALLALFLLLARAGGKYLMVLVVLALAAAAVEFFDKVREQGYQPATLVGIVAVAGLPLAAYWRGDGGIPLVMVLAVMATLVWYMLAGGLESNPAPNTAMTLLGITWIGLLGSFAALILAQPFGVETVVIAVVGTVAYDVGGLFVGSSAGKTQMVPWISPNKTVEGLVGGMLAAILVVVLLHFAGMEPWNEELTKSIWLGITVAVAAPLGDFAESMLKRNLGIKDFGTLLPGHGGALDRIDAMLFVAPAVYYLTLVLF
jgi:phosphatidate cytidylyltransferase